MRKPFGEVKIGETVTFDNGLYFTGHITKNVGTYSGKRMVHFIVDGETRERIFSYAAHRSVVFHA
jgi:hypothetical protein